MASLENLKVKIEVDTVVLVEFIDHILDMMRNEKMHRFDIIKNLEDMKKEIDND